MKKILSVIATFAIVLCAGIFVGCNNGKTQTKAEDFNFTYVKNSATKVVEDQNYNININLNVKNEKDAENTLDASKFTLKQADKTVSTSVYFGDDKTEKPTTEKFESMKDKDISVHFITDKTLTGECILYYGETKLFTVNI